MRIIHSRFNNVNISTIPYTLPTLTKLDQRYSHIETCQYIWNVNQLIGFYVTVTLVSSDSKLGFALIHYDIWWNNWNLNKKTWSLIIFGERFSFFIQKCLFHRRRNYFCSLANFLMKEINSLNHGKFLWPINDQCSPSYRNQSIDLQYKSIDWFLYDGQHWLLMV